MLRRIWAVLPALLLYGACAYAQVPGGSGAQVTGALTTGNCVEASGAKSIQDAGAPCSAGAGMATDGSNATAAAAQAIATAAGSADLVIGGALTATASSGEYTFATVGTNTSAVTSTIGIVNLVGSFNPAGASLTNLIGLVADPIISGSSLTIPTFAAVQGQITTGAGFTGTITTGYGFSSVTPTVGGANPLGTFNGFNQTAITNGNGITSGTVTNRGVRIEAATATAASGGTIVNTGLSVAMPTGVNAGTTTNTGLHITGNGQTGGATNWAINSTSTAPSSLAGSITAAGVSNTGTSYVWQSGGVTGTMAWVPSSTNKTITWPNGTTDFTATGPGSLYQASAGAAITVVQSAVVATTAETNPSATTSTTDVMMGLSHGLCAGATDCSITPVKTGMVAFVVKGAIKSGTANDGAVLSLYYGTGTAPTNGTAPGSAGTTRVACTTTTASGGVSANESYPAELFCLASLSVGTAYWVDAGLAAVTGGTATIVRAAVSAFEL